MAQVNVSIAGRVYRMACDDGEEAHLEGLAQQLDAKILELRGHFGEIGDQRITVMAALTMADDLATARTRIEVLEARVATLEDQEQSAEQRLDAIYVEVADSLGAAARRVERVARDLDAIRRD